MTSVHDLQNRVLSLEMELLEHRLSATEKPNQWDGWVSNHNYGHVGATHSYSRTPHGWGYAQQNAHDAYMAFPSSETCMGNIDQQSSLTLTDVRDADGADYHYPPIVTSPTTSVDPRISTVSIERPCFIPTQGSKGAAPQQQPPPRHTHLYSPSGHPNHPTYPQNGYYSPQTTASSHMNRSFANHLSHTQSRCDSDKTIQPEGSAVAQW